MSLRERAAIGRLRFDFQQRQLQGLAARSRPIDMLANLQAEQRAAHPVSYTHLTLPTNREV